MMLWLAILAATLAAIANWREMDPCDGFEAFFVGMFSLFGAALAGAAVFFAGTGLANLAFDHKDHYERLNLVAIRDGSGVQGAYVWGSGGIGSTGNYMFYYQDGPAKRLANVDGSRVNLFEDSQDAYAINYTGCDLSQSWVAPCFTNGGRVVEIHVPPGSVKTQVDLSLNK